MKLLSSKEIRKKFFEFFLAKDHKKVQSSSLIPAEDPTLLFTNAGMNQFKDLFLGKEKRSYDKAVSIQKCMRAGGKHNDLENVGFTSRHLTFFEMMGNFSFGAYFKAEAIKYAWDFLTKELKLPKEKLYASVYKLDLETYDIWLKDIKISKEKIVKLGEKDNFWQMGDTGPCGPCSEIYIDRGIEFGCGLKSCAPGCDCDRFIEIWNLVFMQYDRQSDGTDKKLAHYGVDTGMGLERLCAIIQSTQTVFDTDIFAPIIKKIELETRHKYNENEKIKTAFRVIVDHIRAASFIIADGGSPSNEGRGYVLRKIIRRALLFAKKLSARNFLPDLVSPLVKEMGDIYPELKINELLIKKLLKSEIERFEKNLEAGKTIFTKFYNELKIKNKNILSGHQAFKLYDTYGFPFELTMVLAKEHDLDVDIKGFEKEMEKQKVRSFKKDTGKIKLPESKNKTKFLGYNKLKTKSKIKEIWVDLESRKKAEPGETVLITTDKSPFFSESGGQIGDTGFAIINDQEIPVLSIYKVNHAIIIEFETPQKLKVGDDVVLVVERESRLATMRNHTATHLLQSALQKILGPQIKQSGSLVTDKYLRFDFTYHEKLTQEQIKNIEILVNKKILENLKVTTHETTFEEAQKKGALAFFGEKYNPESVRVIDIDSFSIELCGGTHVKATGDIGCFKITEFSAPSVGNKRIVAKTGLSALELFQENFDTVKFLSQEFKVKPIEVIESFEKQKKLLKEKDLDIKDLKKQLWQIQKEKYLKNIENIGDIPFLYINLENVAPEDLKSAGNDLAQHKGLYFLTTEHDGKTYFYISASKDVLEKVDLKDIMNLLRKNKFSGGGKNNLQGSGNILEQAVIIDIKKILMLNQT